MEKEQNTQNPLIFEEFSKTNTKTVYRAYTGENEHNFIDFVNYHAFGTIGMEQQTYENGTYITTKANDEIIKHQVESYIDTGTKYEYTKRGLLPPTATYTQFSASVPQSVVVDKSPCPDFIPSTENFLIELATQIEGGTFPEGVEAPTNLVATITETLHPQNVLKVENLEQNQ